LFFDTVLAGEIILRLFTTFRAIGRQWPPSCLHFSHRPNDSSSCSRYIYIFFIYLLCHHTYTFIGWETTTAIANYSGPKYIEITGIEQEVMKSEFFFFYPSIDGSEYLELQGIDVDMLWWNQLILFAMSFVLCFLTYLQLRRVKKDK
jgi:hypothetical protein